MFLLDKNRDKKENLITKQIYIMKKILFLASLAAVAMTSCTSESNEYVGDNTPKEIAFKPITQPTTRTAYNNAVTSTDFPDNYTMQVVAYDIPTSGTAAEYFGGTTGITFQQGGSSGSGTNWGGTTPQYWPLYPSTLNFFAVTNSNITDSSTPRTSIAFASGESAGVVTETATITLAENAPVSTSTAAYGQHDLMYGKGVGVVSNTGNTWTFAASDVVTMQFKHALAWINFTVNANAAASGKITVNSVTLNGASYHGTYTIAHEKFNQTTGQAFSTGTWTNYTYTSPAAPNVVVPNFTTPKTVTTWAESADNRAANTIGSGLLVVPDGGFTSFTVNYTLNGKTYDYTYTPAPAATLVQNTKYYYDITFSLHEILVNPTVENWGDGGNSGVSIP